jgi:hypothetical protein
VEVEEKDRVYEGDVYAHIKGRSFAGIASEHADRLSSDLIEGAPYIVDSILRDVLGRSTTEVNTASIGAVGNDVTGRRPQLQWKYRRSITERENSINLIGSLCFESGMALFQDHQDRETLFAVDYKAPVCTLTSASVLDVGGVPQVRARQTDVSNIFNQFSVRYQYSHARGTFLKEIRCDESSSNMTDTLRPDSDGLGATYPLLCAKSQTIYRKVRKFSHDAEWIGNAETAERFLKHIINWTAIRRWEVEGKFAMTADTLSLELGDTVVLSLDLLPTSVQASNVFLVTRIVDGGLANPGVLTLGFTMVPIVLGTYADGYGFNYGETGYGTQL